MVFLEVITSIFIAFLLLLASGIGFKNIIDGDHDEIVWWGTLKVIELLFVAYVIFYWLSRVG